MSTPITITANNSPVRPFKSYNGGKCGNGSFQKIISLIPKCHTFVDAMVGGGGIVSNLRLPETTIINDIDSAVIDSYVFVAHGVLKECMDYRYLIDKYDSYGSAFYFDPPYLKATRKSKKDIYNYEWLEKDHVDFLEKIQNMKAYVLVSHYPCELYNQYLGHWRTFDFTAQTRAGKANERVYMNFEKPKLLQDYRYIGSDFSERQRIKRKVDRTLKKIAELPQDERSVLLAAIKDNFSFASD